MEKNKEGKTYRLNFELVPDSCWQSNLRTLLKPAVWDAIRKTVYAEYGGKCAICGANCSRLEAHEQWEYDEERKVQRLARVIAVCHLCHSVIHIGYTQLKGDEQAAARHFMKVNGCTYAEYRKALGEANEIHRRRNLVDEWQLDVSALERYLK